MHTDVLIVGAGPAGLLVANLLARAHVNFVMLDKKAGPVDDTRAILIHGRTLELLDKLDLADPAVADGQKMTRVHILINGKQKVDLPLNAAGEQISPYNYSLVHDQSKTERLLLSGLEPFHPPIAWNTELVSLSQNEREVTAVIKRADGSEESITAAYVVGADGAHSTVRQALGVPFEGSSYEYGFFLADVEMTWSRGTTDWFVNLTPHAFFGAFPYGGTHFRLIGTLKLPHESRQKLTLEELRELVAREKGFEDIRLLSTNWATIYRVHRKQAKQFRVGRSFLIGDAAHIHTPAGGQGMNTSLGDAYNLSWKLAAVVKQQAAASLLESYEQERRPIALAVEKGTDQVFNLQITGNPLLNRARLTFIPLLIHALNHVGFDKTLYRAVAQMWVAYRQSPVVLECYAGARGKKREVQAGDRTPYGFLKEGLASQVSLFQLLKGVEHHLLLFAGMREQEEGLLQAMQGQLENLLKDYTFPVTLHLISADNATLHKIYGAPTPRLFLVRPDGYIAYSGQADDLESLRSYLNRVYTRRRDTRRPILPETVSQAQLGGSR
jgi:2-polyprenyl-6-methoxyphenol hydroxylase-like FAD-dependent oxidoreductase